MRHGASSLFLGALAIVACGAVFSAPAAGKPAADDVSIALYLHMLDPTDTKTTGLNFPLNVIVQSGSGVPQKVTVRLALPAGLSWGRDAPDPTEGCPSATPTVCTLGMEVNGAGTVGVGWVWDVVAAAPGFYDVTASVEPEQPDPDTANNTATFRIEVVALTVGGGGSGGGGGGSGGGGGASVSASVVKLMPAKPKAGSAVAATVRVSSGDSAVKPTKLACVGSLGTTKLKGTSRAVLGRAMCTYHPPRAAKGKTLRGAVSFTARGRKFAKRFSARLG